MFNFTGLNMIIDCYKLIDESKIDVVHVNAVDVNDQIWTGIPRPC